MSVWRRWLAAFDAYGLEHGDYAQFGENVVVVDVIHRGLGRVSGLEIELAQTQVWQVRDGRLVRGGLFESREKALDAAARRAQDSG